MYFMLFIKGLFTRREGYPSKWVTLALTHFLFFFLRRVYKAARATRVGGLPYLRARVTLAGGLTFSLVNTPSRVNPPTRVKLSTCFQTLGNCVQGHQVVQGGGVTLPVKFCL